MPARLAQVLVARGLLTPERANEALRQLAVTGGSLDTVLLERGWVSEVPVLQALAEASGYRAVNLADFEANPDVAQLIPPKIADRLAVAPLSVEGSTLHVACGYPVRKAELDEVAFLLGKQLELWVAVEVRIRDWIATIYKQPLPARFKSLLAQGGAPAAPTPAPAPVQAAAPAVAVPALAAPPPPPAAAPRKPQALIIEESESTLEDTLTREMVDRLARNVADEPIPLEVRKKPKAQAPELPPEPKTVQELSPLPPSARSQPDPRPKTQPEFRAPPAAAPAKAAPPPAAAVLPPAGPPPQQTGWSAPAPPPRVAPTAAPRPAPPPPAPVAPVMPDRTVAPTPASLPEATDATFAQLHQDPERDTIPEWTLADARVALKEASATGDRDRIIDVTLRYARRTFDFAAAFAVLRGSAVGWDARGDGATREQIAQVSIPLDANSVFRTVALSRGSFTGTVPPDSLNLHYLGSLGRAPRALYLFPVEVKARLVALIYGDSGQKPFSQRRLSDFLLFCQELPGAFQELILRRKQLAAPPAEVAELTLETGGSGGSGGSGTAAASAPVPEPLMQPAMAPPSLVQAEQPITALQPEQPAPSAPAGLGWAAWGQASTSRMGRAASMPGLMFSEAERPPPDYGAVLRRLTGPDPTERARAMADLARAPEASSRVLASNFPGPTAWSRLPVVELPEADELGPIPGALARLGRPGASALAPLLDSGDSDTRYLALLTAGNLPFPELVDGVLRGLFDLEPDISSAARAAATALRRLPRFDAAMKDLRQELTARDPLRRGLAARALGVLHDRDAIDGLIGLTGSEDLMTGQAAAEALREITKQNFGAQPRQWLMWWSQNRGRRRIEWLVGALRHGDLEIRTAAIEELTRVLNDSLGYSPDAAPADREAAVARWEALLTQGGRWQRVEV